METPAMNYICTCQDFEGYGLGEIKIAEIMGIPVEFLHNFMDNWEDATVKTL